ncbi:MAG TPA: efflux RND transporter periplasmic adaptor subunit [Thermoanaerobaculia bacterium]|nr:efflux RND transporter periplasmic adaptor subunit [Thermoanaerobaculia bacterium]
MTFRPSLSPAAVLRPRAPLAALALAAIACAGGSDGRGERDEAPTPILEAVEARAGGLPLEERLTGVVRAENQVAIRPQISGPVVEVLVRNGETVRRGQPLVRLEEATVREQMRQAEADLRLARAALDEERARVAERAAQVTRTRSLHAQDLVSELDLETQEAQLDAVRASAAQAEARVEQAAATLEERRAALDRAVVRAPVAGRVGQRNAEVGMLAGTDTVLFLLGNLDSLIIEIPLTEQMLGYVDVGQTVRIEAPTLGPTGIEAKLIRISPFLAEGTFSTIGEIDVANPDGRLRPGMFVTVDVLYGESEVATLVPTSALWEDPVSGDLGVYVAPEMGRVAVTSETGSGRATQPVEFRPVEVLAEGRSSVGVRGVSPGEWAITVGQQMLASREEPLAVVRPTTWERVVQLQELQREDVLRSFLEKQQRVTREPASGTQNSRLSGPAPAVGAPTTL